MDSQIGGSQQGHKWYASLADTTIRLAVAAIDDANGLNHFDSGFDKHVDRFQQGVTGRNGVLDDGNRFAGNNGPHEATADPVILDLLTD